ncbi:hypothetical protein [Lawsonella clevelandensis]|uniref:hypothetical protein n=1 Tax=Lawsonella clevelandensis TaxID=1528099 RepID=UPI0023F1F2F5|nr:hypothetical protein [Lawsonella clevelandensis]MDU7193752.1 hypothetical protein [Lawsonella clevelandensis]
MPDEVTLDAIDLRAIADRLTDAALRCDSEMQSHQLLIDSTMFGPHRKNLTGVLGDWAASETDKDTSLDKNIRVKADHIVADIAAFSGQDAEHRAALGKAGM